MENMTLLGIDLAKSTFQLHGVNQAGRCILKRKLSRSKMLLFVANLPQCTIAMEACAGAHYFSRKFKTFGHEVKLIAPQFVKPYVKGNKDDDADAEGICEAASRPNMRFVASKEVWQLDLQTIHRVRQRLMKHRTALMNETRGILYEFGMVIPKGRSALAQALKEIGAVEIFPADLSAQGKALSQNLYAELLEIEEKISHYEQQLQQFDQDHPHSKKLQKIRGIGLLTATALLIVLANPSQFKNGRQFAAFLGLVPRHTGTGGKNRVMGISKRGDQYLRSLLVHGARSVVQVVIKQAVKGAPLDPLNAWVYRIYQQKGYNKAAVALANKNARIAWALMVSAEAFEVKKAAKPLKKAA